MESQKYCVYNQTRESFLSLGVAVADTSPEQLESLIETLTIKIDSGLWAVPFKGIPAVRWVSPVDLVYLDENYRVIQDVESYPTSNSKPLKFEAASALVLPVHTIYSSQTQPGDQLVICVAEEMERRLERLSSSFGTAPPAPSSVSLREKQQNSEALCPSPLQNRSTNVSPIFQGPDEMNDSQPKDQKPGLIRSWLQNWLSSDRRRAKRQPLPGLVAYYWTGGNPKAYRIGDISSTGFFLLTQERWFPGTMILMTLQRTDSEGRNIEDAISVQSKVVRWGDDGVGLLFVLSRESEVSENRLESWANKKTLEHFLERVNLPGEELRTPQK
jgi:uncharacterized membrane protein (UPF0127 family)